MLLPKFSFICLKYFEIFGNVIKSLSFHTFHRRLLHRTIQEKKYVLYKLDKGPSTDFSLTKQEALKMFSKMSVIRKIEQKAARLYTEKLIRGFLHLYSGQEAVAVGIYEALKHNDDVITSYRCHGWSYLKGVSAEGIFGELLGRSSGCVRGKSGSMHMFSKHFYGGNGIVGGHVPLGTGIALACQYNNTGTVCVTLYGDGASNQGQIFEAWNIAKLMKLPCIYVCENNLYAMGTSVQRHTANPNFYTRGDTIPGIRCDGMDVLNMRNVTKFAREYCIKNGPIILEAVTYRYFGHSMSDPGVSYRKREEIDEIRKTRDPILIFKNKILKDKLVTEDELKKIEDTASKEIETAAKAAKAANEIEEQEMAYDIYAKNVAGKVRNNLPWHPMEHRNLTEAVNLK